MKKIYTLVAATFAAVSINAQSWMNITNSSGATDFEVTPEMEVSWDDEPLDTLGIQYEYTDIDVDNYIYPEEGATINPNVVSFDADRDEVVSLDTITDVAVLKFANQLPKLYRGAIIPVIYQDAAYALFVLEAKTDGQTATIHYRNAAITEIFFNRTIHIGGNEQATRSTAGDYDSKVNQTIKLLQLVEPGLKMQLDEVGINFDSSQFDLEFGNFTLFFGRSLNCPFKRLTAVLGGEVTAKGSFSLDPSFHATKGWTKDLKQRLYCFHKYTTIPGPPPIPVDIDFDIDICGELSFTSQITEAFHYAQKIGATLKVQVGAEYNFETGKMIPLNSLEFVPLEAQPEISSLKENIHFSFDAAVFPRIKIYFYHFKYAGWGCDLRPVFARLAFNSCLKGGHVFFDTTFSLGSKVKGFIYVWDFGKRANHYLAETPDFDKIWWSWKSPADIKDKDKDNIPLLNYAGQSQCTFNVSDLAYEWDQQSFPPAAASEMSIEVEKFGTLPDPATNPEYYKTTRATSPAKTADASESGWYSYGLDYYPLDDAGDAHVPFKVETPAGDNFKLVARILDGHGRVVKEVEHPVRSGIKAYTIRQQLAVGESVVTVRDYGEYVHEVTTYSSGGATVNGDITYQNGKITGTLTVQGHSVPVNSFYGSGNLHQKLAGSNGKMWTMSESYDNGRWAHEKLGTSTDGASYVNTTWKDMPATRVSIPGAGTFTYIGNCMVDVDAGESSIHTISLQIDEE